MLSTSQISSLTSTRDLVFTLDKNFVEKYKNVEEPFGFSGLGRLIYERTYSRVKEDNTLESWYETVERVVNGVYTMQLRHIKKNNLFWTDDKAQESAKIMYDKIFNFKFTPPGRGLWAMGSKLTMEKELYTPLNNCGFISTEHIDKDSSEPFCFLMDMSMLGVGIGFDVKGADKVKVIMPMCDGKNQQSIYCDSMFGELLTNARIKDFMTTCINDLQAKIDAEKDHTPEYVINSYMRDLKMYKDEFEYINSFDVNEIQQFRIADSREGWVESLGLLVRSYLEPNFKPVVFDYSAIRPPGLLLKTFGGKSSGPIPLLDLHCMVRYIFGKNMNKPITITTITDIMNLIGKAVVAGNVRRCLPAGTRVHIYDEKEKCVKFVPIEKIEVGMLAVMYEDGKICYAPITQKVSSIQLITKLHTEIGDVNSAMNHTFAITKFKGADMTQSSQGYQFVAAGFLTAGDEIVLSIHDDLHYLEPQHRDAIITTIKKKYPNLPKEGNGAYKIPNGTYNIKIIKSTNTAPNLQAECYDLTVDKLERFAIEQGFIVHNSSEIALGPIDSEEFLNLKNMSVNPERASYMWNSNNSVVIDTANTADYEKVAELTQTNGEPGYLWINNCRNYSRMGHHEPDFKDIRVAGTNPCSEQSLESFELCCLVETFLNNHETMPEYLETLKYAYLYAKTVTLGTCHWIKTNQVMMRNRRIGTSVTGIAQFLGRHKVNELKEWLDTGYNTIQKYDKVYSEWFAVPRSIKTTSVKPSGCVVPETKIVMFENSENTKNRQETIREIGDLFKKEKVDFARCQNTNIVDKWIIPKYRNFVKDINGEKKEVKKLYLKGMSETYKIKFDDGTEIICSPEHKFLVENDEIVNPEYYVRADQLSANMNIKSQ